MQAQSGIRKPAAWSIVGLVGGVLLVIGPLLAWATVSLNTEALAQALGIDPSLLSGVPSKSESVNGFDSPASGKWVLIAGIVVLVLAVVSLVQSGKSKLAGTVLIVAGLVGLGFALYDVTRLNDLKDEALSAISGLASQAGIDVGVLDAAIDVSAGFGIWLAMIGAVLAIIGGIMGVASKAELTAMSSATSMDSGFEAPSPAAPLPSEPAMPPAEPTTPAPMPPAEPTAPMPPAEPAMPAPTDPTPASEPKPNTPGDDQGGTTA